MEETVRLRLVFEDRHMLSKSQKSEGLKRSWLLLKSQHQTISDVASHLLHIFDLRDSCSNGLLLSMDGFVFPPFESTCILRDKDIIRVKKKVGKLSNIINVADGPNSFEDEEIAEKQPVVTGVKFLANEEFEKESGGYQSEPEDNENDESEDTLPVENASSKKRKAPKKLESSKRKKRCPVPSDDVGNDIHTKQVGRHHLNDVLPKKTVPNLHKPSDRSKLDTASTPGIVGRCNNTSECSASPKRYGQLRQNTSVCIDASNVIDATQKFPSRSARRKKAKRKWLRELAKVEKEKQNQRESPENEVHNLLPEDQDLKTPTEDQNQDLRVSSDDQDQNSEAEDDIVPVVIRPGHIRFEPLGKDQVVQQEQVHMETIHWNGITSKKKGQKWGREKFSFFRKNECEEFDPELSKMLAIEEEMPVNDSITVDFDKLAPLHCLPKDGDTVAYRLLELSSSFTPELSPFRVGKVSSYDSMSNKIILIQVPEYPIIPEKNLGEDASGLTAETSSYNEDGSLEIDFTSLVDVRIVKLGYSHTSVAPIGEVNGVPVGNQDAVSVVMPSINGKETHASTTENGVDVWDEISQVLSAKKVQLSENGCWDKRESSGRRPWSYRALRSSALGPTMALLRAQNEL